MVLREVRSVQRWYFNSILQYQRISAFLGPVFSIKPQKTPIFQRLCAFFANFSLILGEFCHQMQAYLTN